MGTPLVTDECTVNKLRISYARILVEVDITQELVKEITIRDASGNCMKQLIDYEWKPVYCGRYKDVGHNCDK